MREYDNYMWTDPRVPHATRALPIYDWKSQDIWAAPRCFGWDYNRTYDVLQRLGIPVPAQRVAPPFGEEPFQRLWQYAQGWPDLWEKMLHRVDGAAAAGRYSRSPLYSAGSQMRAPHPGMTWENMIREQLSKWPAEYSAKIAGRIRDEIKLHNKKTRNAAIPDFTKDGLSWSFLYMIAVRGDLKGRRRPQYIVEP